MIIENQQLQTIFKDTYWSIKGRSIAKTFKFETFSEAVDFLDRVAAIAEQLEHDPDVDITENRVKIILSTRDEGGVTEKDVDMATKIDDQLD